jgi:hypothetical protein
MTVSPSSASIYALYLSQSCVELRLANDSDSTESHLFSREKSYYAALDFGRDLAAYKKIPFINHVNYIKSTPQLAFKLHRPGEARFTPSESAYCA